MFQIPNSPAVEIGGGDFNTAANNLAAPLTNMSYRFNGLQSSFGNVSYGTTWCFNKAQNWVCAGGHAKTRATAGGDPKTDLFFPAGTHLTNGFPIQTNICIASQSYLPLFRPDSQPN